MVVKQSSEYYSLEIKKQIFNGKVYYDRDHREKSWFYLVLNTKTQNDIHNSQNDGG